tara:strand:+ start:180 stop:359 length:180 start_codon:yes stop_codon:yes gene_type:complete
LFIIIITEGDERMAIYKCELYFDDNHNEDEFIGGIEVDADSEENAWEELKKLITIKETK